MLKEKIQIGLGLWIILSPWLLGFSNVSLMKWSNIIIGTAVFLFNLWAVFDSDPKTGAGPPPSI